MRNSKILYNDINTLQKYNQEGYNVVAFEQYKIYIEMADRISQRRHNTNVMFVTIHSILLGALGIGLEKFLVVDSILSYSIAIISLLLFSLCWLLLLKSYRNLNSVKFKVIGLYEKQLPTSPFNAEWSILCSGNNIKKYISLSLIESSIPMIFIILYVSIWIYIYALNF